MSKHKDVTFIIGGLSVGGAETFMLRLARKLSQKGWSVRILSLQSGNLSTKLESEGLEYKVYNPDSFLSTPFVLQWMANKSKGILQGWMDMGNFFAGLVGHLKQNPIVWTIRRTLPAVKDTNKTKIALNITKYMSYFTPDRIIANSKMGKASYANFGFNKKKINIIRNGWDCNYFSSDYNTEAFKQKYNLGNNPGPIIGRAGRYTPMKDFPCFFEAFRKIKDEYPGAKALACGSDVNKENNEIRHTIDRLNISDDVRLLGEIDNMRGFYTTIDLMLSSSKGEEGCPNVIGEAMACGTPCIATDVGDSAYLLDNDDFVVRPENPDILAKKAISFFDFNSQKKQKVKNRLRKRAVNNFSINAITKKYIDAYKEISSG